MELGKMRHIVFQWMGWSSVIMGLTGLLLLNGMLLSGFDIPIATNASFYVISFILGFVSIFQKKSRSLGLWGIGLSIYFFVFIILMFGLGWAIVPFP
ncbi:hypothetical protein [Bacillus sinesaloumensis]|uniref:hypothetical protein n=1 Tax=Litchfieldia sinesaloumensis TaxID=1926280 RepID=UPI0009886AE4|nr:hypothetical protein [Bacillus sinesaloumensis]